MQSFVPFGPGTRGGAGFRDGAISIILVATDAGIGYQPDNTSHVTGFQGIRIPTENFTGASRPETPNGRGASIQQAIDALLAQHGLVVGLGTNKDINDVPRRTLEAFSLATGTINRSNAPINSNIADDPILPGEPLYFRIACGADNNEDANDPLGEGESGIGGGGPGSGDSDGDNTCGSSANEMLINGVSTAIEAAVRSAPILVSLQSDDSQSIFRNLSGNVLGTNQGRSEFSAEFKGDGQPHRFELQFERVGTSELLGTIPVAINDRYRYDSHAIDPDGDKVTFKLTGETHGAVIDANSGKIRWRPSAPGVYNFTLIATDEYGATDSQTWTMSIGDIRQDNHQPVIESIPDLFVMQGNTLQYDVSAQDPDIGDQLRYTISGTMADRERIFDGLTISSSTGRIHWKTSDLNVGQHQAYIRVTDGRGGVAEAPIRVTVLPLGASLNTSPTIASEASVLAVVGETYRYRVDAFDPDFDPLEFRLLSHPQGMVIDPDTGELAWRPSIEDQGIHDVLLLVNDGRGGNASQSFSMFVQNGNLPPVFHSQPILEIGAGSNWKYQPIANDPNGDSIEFSLLNAPENMQMGPSGLLTYSSTGQGLHHVKILADDKKGGTAVQEFLLEVGDNTPPEIKSNPKTKSIKGREYRYPIDVFDADSDLVRVSLDQSSLDSGIIIVGSTLSWSPQSTGVFAIQLFATDEHGATTIQQFSLEVVEPVDGNTAPEIISQARGPGMKDSHWAYQLIAFDLEDDPITFSLQAGPSSATITPQTGILNWLPTNHGLFEFTVTATDSSGAQSKQKFSLTVLPNSPPRFVSTIKSKLEVNQLHEQTLVVVDPNPEDSVTYSLRIVRNLSEQSDGFSIPQINRDTGLLNWLPDTSGVYELVFEARDKSGAIASKREIVLVTDPSLPNRLPTIVSSPRQLVQAERTLIHHFISIDPDHDDLTYKLLSGPDGMELTANGFLKWNTSINDVTTGTNPHTFTVQVNDRRGGKDIKSYFVDVTEESVNSAPIISSIPRPNAVVAKSIEYQAIAPDADRDTLIWKLTAGDGTSLPVAGATIDPSSGLFRWIPSLNQIGTHHFQISVFDPFGGIDRQKFSIAVRGVNRPANIESTAPRIAVLNTEYVYDVIGFDPDFDEVSYVIVGSAPSGMVLDRKTGLFKWVPKEIGSYQVQIRAVDTLGAGTTQRVFIDVYAERPNSPPVFDPVNPGFAEAGRTYRKKFVAKDPDGDEVTYRLENPIPGMTVNSETGEVTWTPVASNIGSEVTINIVATDEKGKVARYNAKLPVLAPNNPPVFLSQPKVSLIAGNVYRYDMRAEDKDGDRLVFSLLTVPPQVTLDERSGQISWASKIEDAGKSFTFRVALTDDRVEQPIIQQWTVTLLADNNAPTVNLLVVGNDKDNFSFDPGTSLGFEVRAHDLGRITSKRLLVNGERISLNDSGFGRFTFDEPGIYRVTAIAVDAFGNVGSKVREILVRNPNSFAPSNVLHSPIRGSVLTAPSAIRLSVTDNDDDLKTVRVFFAPLDQSTPYQLLAERLAPVGSTLSNIQDESIGIFDPTILANGEYIIRVVSTDGAFNQTTTESQVTVTGRLKLGNFTTDFVDLSLPSALIPIVIQRRYDTLNASKIGDFGYGWNLEVKTVKSRVDRETLGGPGLQGLRAFVDGTRIVITTPDGSEQGFTFRGIPDQTLFGIVLSWKAWFEPDAGNTFTLSSPANGLLKVGEEYISASGTTFNPAHSEFGNVLDAKSIIEKLTYRINARTGLSSTVIDRNDNSITITPDGVISSAGRSILFDRDTQGRIVAITDPRGSVIRYEYDYAGNLVRVIDRMGDAVQFHYHTEPAHYLDRIVNQLGSTVVKARYASVDFTKGASDGQNGDGEQSPVHYGRLSSIEDVNGVVTQLKFDPNKREQEIRNDDGLIAIVTLDSFGNPIKTIDRAGTQFYRTYNLPDKGLVTTETMIVGTLDKKSGEANDLTIRYSYNGFGQVTSMVDYRGNETRYTYSRTGEPRSTVSPEGISTYFQYDDKFNLTMQSSSEGTTSFITYDSKGKPTEIRSGRFNTFDGEGNGSGSGFGSGGSDEGPQGGVLKIDYNTFGEISKLTDTDGKTRSNFYDSNGNLTLSEFEWVDPENANNRRLLAINNDHNLNDQRVGARNAQSSVSFELDAMRRTSRTIDGDGFVSESLYNRSGAVVENRSQRTDQFGELKWYVSRFVYDDLGRVTHSTENALENHANSGTAGSAISYDNLGRIRKSEGRQKVVIAIEPDENNPSIYTSRLIHAGTITSVSETTFDSLGRETEIKNIFGNRTQTLYDAYGQVIESRREVFDSSGNASWLTSRVAYDSLGRILVKTSEFPTEITVPIGMALSPKVEGSSYVYDSLGRVASVNSLIDVEIGISSNDIGVYSFLNAAGSVIGQSKKIYDNLGRLHKDVNTRGQITEYEYDSRNRRTATLGHPVPSKSVGLEAEYPGLMVRTRSEVINNEYGQMTKIRSNILQIETVNGLIVSIDRSKMHEVTQRFNAEGNLVESIFPDGSSIKSEYDALGKLDSEIDQMGNRKQFDYDSSGTLSSSSLPSYTNQNNQTVTPTYEYAYDVQGLMASLIDPLGRKTEFTYSATGLMKTRTLPSQEKETIDYDAKDRVILRVSFEGIHQRTIYDDTKIGEGRLLAREWFANATDYNQYRVEGGFNGNLPPNTKWERLSFEYDIYGRITKQIHETFLGAKNGTPVVVESRQTWTSEFNTNGLVTRVMGPTGFISYEYDPLGNKLATVGGDEAGRVLLRIEYEHDDLGRLQTVSTVTRDGELLDANASIDGNQPEKTTYHYDPFGRLSYLSMPNDVVEAYEFDILGRLLSMRHYKSDSNNQTLTDNPKLSEFRYDYRPDGKRISLVERFWNQTIQSNPHQENRYDWEYDPTGRLVREILDSSDDTLDRTESFVMDATGNRMERRLDRVGTQNDRIELYSYDVNDRVLAEYEYSVAFPIVGEFVPEESDLIKSTSYDWNGTQKTEKSETTKGGGKVTHIMEYDYQGKLASVAIHQFDANSAFVGGTKEFYQYDQNGSRIVTKRLEKVGSESSDWVELSTTKYLIDSMNFTGYDQVILENRATTDFGVSGGQTKFTRLSYVYGLDEITQSRLDSDNVDGSESPNTETSTVTFVHDGHGSVRALVGPEATPVQAFVYAAYGEILAVLNPTGILLPVTAIQTNMLYNGEAFSKATGLYNMRARWYDPSQGRFERLDPFAGSQNNPQSFHKYAFVHGDPIQNIDPTGEFSTMNVTMTMGVIGGIIGGTIGYYGKGTISGMIGGIVVGATLGVGAAYLLFLGASSFGAVAAQAGTEVAWFMSALFGGTAGLISLFTYPSQINNQQLHLPTPGQARWDFEYATLAMGMYGDIGIGNPGVISNAWSSTSLYINNEFGYKAIFYTNTNRGEGVMAYQGTDSMLDWANNIVQGLEIFGDSYQYRRAKHDIWDARRRASQMGLSFVATGHSLGGGMATTAAIEAGVPAVVFNAAGTSYSSRQARLITNYRIRGDILSTLQDAGLYGWGMPNSTPSTTYWLEHLSYNVMDRHGKDVLPAMRRLF
ncbi:MAG: putative Ig domain-containing protein [Pirellula sp.]